MQRLVYSPKVFAYVRTHGSVEPIDISPYLTSGQVSRKINQVSSASLTLRNTDFRFTKQGGNGHAIFHPMDPITIYMQRLRGKPVQVFTGYLDTTPYIELFPGTITLQASCTLKRLLYTFFDPALPYTNGFLGAYGWKVNYKDGQMFNITAEQSSFKDQGNLTDGSIGNLLFATLKHIGRWHPNNIFIEKLPDGIAAKVTKIYDALAKENKQSQAEFEHLMTKLIGPGQFGNSSMAGGNVSTGNIKGEANIVPVVIKIANSYNIPAAFVLAVMMQETTLTGKDGNISGGGGLGWFQWNNPAPYHAGPFANKSIPNWQAQAHDLGFATDVFSQTARAILDTNKSYAQEGNWQAWAQAVQTSDYSTGGRWPNSVGAGKSLAAKYANVPASGSTVTPANPSGSNTGGKKKRIKANAGSSGFTTDLGNAAATVGQAAAGTAATANGTYSLPLEQKYLKSVKDLGSVDQGVDIETAPVGAAVYSITNGICTAVASNGPLHSGGGFGPNYPVIQATDGPLKGKYIYYGHVGKSFVKKGDTVSASEKIAELTYVTSVGLNIGHIEIGFSDAAGTPISSGLGSSTKHGSRGTAGGDQMYDVLAALITGSPILPSGGGVAAPTAGSTPGDQLQMSKATAFATFLNGPSLLEAAEALALKGAKSLMNDKPLFPFIEQLAKACMRNFMSAPNGDFIAFFPDYFGAWRGQRPASQPYWHISDLEILDGRIAISDDSLTTHLFVVGDTIPGTIGTNPLPEKLASGGVVNVFNAFQDNWIAHDKKSPLADKKAAIEFLQRYGPRPVYLEEAFIRAPYFETFYAYQQFLLMWSQQFLTDFKVTFMPELYPGGLVAFDNHNLQCYIEEVTHNFDYESGFTTDVKLSAPAVPPGGTTSGDPSEGMVLASSTKTG